MNQIEKRLIVLHTAKQQLEKELKAYEKRVEKASDALHAAHRQDTSMKQRANLRTKLSILCEQRDRVQGYLDETKRWMAEVKSE